jgi:hypothetical protein
MSVPIAMPPQPPVLTEAAGGDRRAILRWAPATGSEAVEFRIYRTCLSQPAPPERLKLTASVRESGSQDASGCCLTDTGLMAHAAYLYQITAVDIFGRESAPSAPAAVRTYLSERPDPPRLDAPRLSPDGVLVLSWSGVTAGSVLLLERRVSGSTFWRKLSGWLSPGTDHFADRTRRPGIEYEYRLRALDERGRQSSAFSVVTA